jgi:two-component system chemotaxis response regulator CheY
MRRYIAQRERGGTLFNSRKLCLITDDSPIVRKVARRLLGSLAFEVDEAENGEVALRKCELRMPDVILLDWNMPIMNGIQFLRRLRGIEGGMSPKVVFCTTEDSVEYIREAIEAGADEYVIKPFDAETLRAKLRAVA